MIVMVAPVLGQDYPSRPIKLIIPFGPGGGADAIARPLAEKLSVLLGQPVVVENRAGGQTVIAGDLVAKAPPDGYTLYLPSSTHAVLPYLVRKLPFDPIRDFTHIAMIASGPHLILSNPSQPFATLKEMIAYAKANPGKLSVGVTEAVSLANAQALKKEAKIDYALINYKGGGALITDLVGGHVPVGLGSPVLYLPFQKDKRLNALAVTSPRRLSLLPDVPTVAEIIGVPQYDVQTWFAVSAPPGLPPAIQDRLQRELAKILAEPDMRKRLIDIGYEPAGNDGPAATTALMKSYMERIGGVLQESGFKPE